MAWATVLSRSTNGAMPVRWTSPEGMKDQKYSSASDVWSFGVTCIEIFQDAATPYIEFTSNSAVMAMVITGQVHAQPAGCTDQVYAELLRCFSFEPARRPDFTSLEAFFARMTEPSNLFALRDTGSVLLNPDSAVQNVYSDLRAASLASQGDTSLATPTAPLVQPATSAASANIKPQPMHCSVAGTGGTDLGTYDLGFQGREGTTELGQYDLGSEDLGHASRPLSVENSLTHLQRESIPDADYALETGTAAADEARSTITHAPAEQRDAARKAADGHAHVEFGHGITSTKNGVGQHATENVLIDAATDLLGATTSYTASSLPVRAVDPPLLPYGSTLQATPARAVDPVLLPYESTLHLDADATSVPPATIPRVAATSAGTDAIPFAQERVPSRSTLVNRTSITMV